MLILKNTDFLPAYNNSISTTHTSKSILSLHCFKQNSIPHTEIKSIWTTHTQNKSISMLPQKTSIFSTRTQKQGQFSPAQKMCQFRFSHENQVNFYPPHKAKLIATPTLKSSQFRSPTEQPSPLCLPPDTKTKLISIHTPNQLVLDPHTKPSQFWSLHWNQVNPDHPHWNQV